MDTGTAIAIAALVFGGGGVVGISWTWWRGRQSDRWTSRVVSDLLTGRAEQTSHQGTEHHFAYWQLAPDDPQHCAEWAVAQGRLKWDKTDPARSRLLLPDEPEPENISVIGLWKA